MTKPTTLTEAQQVYPPVWVIYDHPKDFPQDAGYVVRVWWGEFPEPIGRAFPNPIEAREWIVEQGGCMPFMRDASEDAVILESWI